MNSKNGRLIGSGFAVAMAVAGTLGASQAEGAATIGVKFLGGRNVAGTPVTSTAGVVPISNWNNLGGTNDAATALTASDGTSSGASVTLSTTGGTGTWSTGATADGGNGSLLDGYIDDGNGQASTATFSGLAAGNYNVYVYIQGDAARPGNDGDGLPNYDINGTRYYMESQAPPAGAFAGFTQASLESSQSVGPGSFAADNAAGYTAGNYIVVPATVSAAGTLTLSAGADTTSFRSPLDGVEIVPASVPEPASLSVLTLGAVGLVARRRRSI